MAPQLAPAALFLLAFTSLAVAVATDLKERRVYDWLTVPTLLLALGIRFALVGWGGPLGLGSGLAGGLLSFSTFYLLALGGGMGMGDVKLMAGIGAILGWEKILTALVLISLAGGAQALFASVAAGNLGASLRASFLLLISLGQKKGAVGKVQTVPYAVAIAAGTLATFFFRGLAVCAVVVCLSGPLEAKAESTLHLGVGTQKVMKVHGGLARIAVGDPNIADVRPLGDGEILVVGIKEGRTTLLVWRNNGLQDSHQIVVRKVSTEDLADEVRGLIGDREGIIVMAAGEQVIIDGEVYTPEDHRRVLEVLDLYPGVRSMVRVAPRARKLAIEEINMALQQAGLRHVSASIVGSSLFLDGTVESQADLQKADLIVRALGQRAENLVTVGIKRMVLSEVHFLEVRRSDMRQLGIRFPYDLAGNAAAAARIAGPLPGLEDGVVAVGSYDTLVEGSGQWSLRMAVDKGYGRLLAQPTLVCASGEEAEFLAGGEVPVPLITQTSNAVEFRKYGVVLRLRPTADRNGNIMTEIEAEVSELDRSVAVAVGPTIAVPGFRNRSVKTNVTVRNGETIVLSGVYSLDEQKSVSKVPLLGDIPIIGELFKQRTIDESERELLIFVTPRIINPGSDVVQDRIEGVKDSYQDAEGDVGFRILD